MKFAPKDRIPDCCMVCDQSAGAGDVVLALHVSGVLERAGHLELGSAPKETPRRVWAHVGCAARFIEHMSMILGHLLRAQDKLRDKPDLGTPAKTLIIPGR